MPFDGSLAPRDRTLELLNELGEAKVFSLLLSGGEPTLHPNFLEFLNIASRTVAEVTVNTNGILLSRRDFAEELHSIAPNALVAVSLDSSDIEINNLHRNGGGAQAFQAINNLCELGQPMCISTVMTGDNFETAEDLIDTFFPKVKVFRFFPRVPRSPAEAFLNDQAYWGYLKDFYERLGQRTANVPALKIVQPYQSVDSDRLGMVFQELNFCCCAFTKLFINSGLDVFPCYYSANIDTCIGNLQIENLMDVWNGSISRKLRETSKDRSLCGLSFFGNELPHKYINVREERPARD
jgi:MoaA/NifB/PqqE/SkfB family radical SAM enzyme